MNFQKNDVVTVRIEDMSQTGEGIGKAEGYALFVKDTVIGDLAEVKIVKAKKNYGFGRLLKIVEPSNQRVNPVCPIARQCGGCQLQMLDYQEQLKFKQEKVKNDLVRIGGFTDVQVEPIIGMEEPFRYRNKAQFPVGRDKQGQIITGFYAGRTHTIIPCTDCALGVEVNREILADAFDEMLDAAEYDELVGENELQ